MTDQVSPVVEPGHTKLFRYYGEQIPNQVLIQNLSTDRAAQYVLHSGKESWSFYGTVEPGRTASVLVNWPTSDARFTNRGTSASISIGGDGIFPIRPESQ